MPREGELLPRPYTVRVILNDYRGNFLLEGVEQWPYAFGVEVSIQRCVQAFCFLRGRPALGTYAFNVESVEDVATQQPLDPAVVLSRDTVIVANVIRVREGISD
jgi:hypothetical protein